MFQYDQNEFIDSKYNVKFIGKEIWWFDVLVWWIYYSFSCRRQQQQTNLKNKIIKTFKNGEIVCTLRFVWCNLYYTTLTTTFKTIMKNITYIHTNANELVYEKKKNIWI